MAKSQKKIQEEVEILVAEEVTLAPKKEKEVVIEQPKTVKKPEKMVKVKMKDRHKCCIGGEWYYLEEGKQYNVCLLYTSDAADDA